MMNQAKAWALRRYLLRLETCYPLASTSMDGWLRLQHSQSSADVPPPASVPPERPPSTIWEVQL